jgi:hypothetical protein
MLTALSMPADLLPVAFAAQNNTNSLTISKESIELVDWMTLV